MRKPLLPAGSLTRRVHFQRNGTAKGFMDAGKNDWRPFAEAWANVQDVLPTRHDRLSDTLNIVLRPTRIRLRYRTDITPDMRIVIDPGLPSQRICEILGGPVELGRREGLEILAQDCSTQGEPA